jgi:hypothetical protein
MEKNRNGAGGYSIDTWHNSEILNHLRYNPQNSTIISNDPWVIYHHTEEKDLYLSPRETMQRSNDETDDLSNLEQRLEETGSIILIWLSNTKRDYLYDLTDLKTFFSIELIKEFSDGSIFCIRNY